MVSKLSYHAIEKKEKKGGGIPQIKNSPSPLIIVNYCSIRLSCHSGRLFIFDGRATVPFSELSYCDCHITIFAILSPIIEKNPIIPSQSKIPAVVSNDSTPLNHSVICRDTERIKHKPTRPARPGKNILTIVPIFICIPRFGIFHSYHLNSFITSVQNVLGNVIPDFLHLRPLLFGGNQVVSLKNNSLKQNQERASLLNRQVDIPFLPPPNK